MNPVKIKYIHLVWGIVLILAGIGVFFLIPQKMSEIKKISYFASFIPFIYFCFYLLGVLLIGGGLKKINNYYLKIFK